MLLTERAQIVSTGNVSQRTCPRCQSARVFRRHRLARWQNWLSRMNYYPYRCHACGYRFITKSRSAAQEEVRPEVRKQRIRRMIGDVVIGAICLAIFLLFLYFVSRPAPNDDDSRALPGSVPSQEAVVLIRAGSRLTSNGGLSPHPESRNLLRL